MSSAIQKINEDRVPLPERFCNQTKLSDLLKTIWFKVWIYRIQNAYHQHNKNTMNVSKSTEDERTLIESWCGGKLAKLLWKLI